MLGKEAKYEKVLEATLRLAAQNGLSKVNHSGVARASGISRAWIYKYIGLSQKALLQEAVRFFGEKFAELQRRPPMQSASSLKAELRSGNEQLIRDVKAYPWVFKPALENRHRPNAVGEAIDGLLERYLKTLSEELKSSGVSQPAMVAKLITAYRFGLLLEFGYFLRSGPEEEGAALASLHQTVLGVVDENLPGPSRP